MVVLLFAACGNGNDRYDASGTFEATEIIVSSEANGRLVELDVDEGARVEAGRQVGLVDTMQLHYTRLQLTESMRMTDSRSHDIATQLASLSQQIATQRRERSRVETLIAANAANTKQLDDIDAAIAVLEKQLAAQRTTLESSNRGVRDNIAMITAQIGQVDDQLAKCRIASPISGSVLSKYAEQGEVTATGKPLFKVADTDNMILRAYVTADQLEQVKPGQKVTVTPGTDSGKSYEGTVSWIAERAEFTPKNIQTRNERANLVYAIKVAVPNDGYLKIGMYGDVKF